MTATNTCYNRRSARQGGAVSNSGHRAASSTKVDSRARASRRLSAEAVGGSTRSLGCWPTGGGRRVCHRHTIGLRLAGPIVQAGRRGGGHERASAGAERRLAHGAPATSAPVDHASRTGWGRTERPPVPVRTTRGSAPVAAKTRRPAATERERDATGRLDHGKVRTWAGTNSPAVDVLALHGRPNTLASSIILNGSADRCLERCARKRSGRPSCRNRATKLLLVALRLGAQMELARR